MPKVAMRIIAEARTRSLAGPSPPARQRAAVWDMLPLEGTPMGAASRFVMPSHISRLDLSKRWCDAFSMIRAAMLISMMPMAAMVSALSTTWPMMNPGRSVKAARTSKGPVIAYSSVPLDIVRRGPSHSAGTTRSAA